MLIAAVAGAERCFGWQPPAKVSMMIMRPPQQLPPHKFSHALSRGSKLGEHDREPTP
jgi:hypothetical protein